MYRLMFCSIHYKVIMYCFILVLVKYIVLSKHLCKNKNKRNY